MVVPTYYIVFSGWSFLFSLCSKSILIHAFQHDPGVISLRQCLSPLPSSNPELSDLLFVLLWYFVHLLLCIVLIYLRVHPPTQLDRCYGVWLRVWN